MLCLISLKLDHNRLIEYYVLFESHTESFIDADAEVLKNLMLEQKVEIRNVRLIEGTILDGGWPNPTHIQNTLHNRKWAEADDTEEYRYMLVCKSDEDKFKISSSKKIVSWISGDKLRKIVDKKKVMNCTVDSTGTYKSIDAYTIIRDTQLDKLIAEKYNRHIALTSLMGHNMTFEYIIEGAEVRLTKYTGKAKDVIIPKFITSIIQEAFYNEALNKLTLENGLKYIGKKAFFGCNIAEIVIPETVELLFQDTFYGNKQLVTAAGQFTKELKILNKNATIIKM